MTIRKLSQCIIIALIVKNGESTEPKVLIKVIYSIKPV